MRHILILLFSLISTFALSQDTAYTTTPPDALSIWRQSTTLPAGVEADTIRARFKDGVYWIRVIYNGVYTLQMAGVKDNNTDQTTLVNRLLAKPYVKGIELSSDSSRKYVINGSVNFNGKGLSQKNGCWFSGTGTISNAVVEADVNSRVFDSTLNYSNITSTTGELSAKWFSMVGNDTLVNNLTMIRKVMTMIRNMGGYKLLYPAGTYVSTSSGGGSPEIFSVYSNTEIRGEGMYRTTWKLAYSDNNRNFRRMFRLIATSSDIFGVKIHDGTIDMNNKYTTYPPGGDWVGTDAQNNCIFTYSDNYKVRQCEFYNLVLQNTTGDGLGFSTNSEDFIIFNVWQRNNLRHGFTVGGTKGVRNLNFDNIGDLPDDTLRTPGGQSFHIEPYDTVRHVTLTNSRVWDWSMSGTDGTMMNNVEAFGTSDCIANSVSNFTLTNSFAQNCNIQIGMWGNTAKVQYNMFRRLYLTSIGSRRSFQGIDVSHNVFRLSALATDALYPIEANNLPNVTASFNQIYSDSSTGIRLTNSENAYVANNEIYIKGGPNKYGVDLNMTSPTLLGAGMFTVYNNRIYSPVAAIRAVNASAVIGTNELYAPTRLLVTGPYTKIFPFVSMTTAELSVSTFPSHGDWRVGDRILLMTGSTTTPVEYRCTTAGSLFEGVWSAGGTYRLNNYVQGSNGQVYKSIVSGGEAEDPVLDLDSSYWVKTSTTVAVFGSFGLINSQFRGSGNPNGVVSASAGAIYHNNTPLSVYSVVWFKRSGTNTTTGWDTISASTVSGGITSLNGLTGSTQTFGNPNLDATSSSWTSGGSVHTPNIPLKKAIHDSLLAQANVYFKSIGLGDSLLYKINDSTLGFKTLYFGLNINRRIVNDSTIELFVADSATIRFDTTNNRVQIPQGGRMDIYNTNISINNETGSMYWAGNKFIIGTTGAGTGNPERSVVIRAGTSSGMKGLEITTNFNTAPATASTTGTAGEIRIAAVSGTTYLFFCVAANTWMRAPLSTW